MSFFCVPTCEKRDTGASADAPVSQSYRSVFRALHPAVTALLGGKLLLQSRLAVIQQQILVVLEVPLTAVLGERDSP